MNLVTSKERLLQYLENKDIDKSTFYEKTGIKRGLLDADKLKSALSDQFIAKIIAIYDDLNIRWLITGKGLMIEVSTASMYDNGNKLQLEMIVKLSAENALLKKENEELKLKKKYENPTSMSIASEP
jgi:hypothetical protein